MPGSNYPPGVSAGTPNAPWNAPDRSHECIFEHVEGPIFEDGEAMFYAHCEYSEGIYGDGWSCEEEQWWQCNVERVMLLRDSKPDITYLASEEDFNAKWHFIERVFEDALIAVEITDFKEISILDCDLPSGYGDGYVRVSIGDKYEVVYKQ